MVQTHCHRCGGFMSYRKRLSYRLPSATTPRVTAHTGVCSCSVPILDGPPPGFASIPGMPGMGSALRTGGPPRAQFQKHVKM